MSKTSVVAKTRAELDLIVQMVREVFEAAGINTSKIKATNTGQHSIGVSVEGKVRVQKKSYVWTLFYEFRDSKIIYVAYEGPGTEMSLTARADIYFSPRKYGIASEDMRARIEKHDQDIEKLIEGQREILNTVSIFNKTVSAALAAFTLKLQQRFRTQLPDAVQDSAATS